MGKDLKKVTWGSTPGRKQTNKKNNHQTKVLRWKCSEVLKKHQRGLGDKCKVSKRDLSREQGAKVKEGIQSHRTFTLPLKKIGSTGTFQRVRRSVTFLLLCNRSYCCAKNRYMEEGT